MSRRGSYKLLFCVLLSQCKRFLVLIHLLTGPASVQVSTQNTLAAMLQFYENDITSRSTWRCPHDCEGAMRVLGRDEVRVSQMSEKQQFGWAEVVCGI